jgi:hypothetical protein
MLTPLVPPSEDSLIRDLTAVRDEGLPRLRHLNLPALTAAARIVTLDETLASHVVVEALLRRAAARFGGGHYGDAAVALLGLDVGTRGLNSKERREIAAEAFERTYETFRKKYEPLLFQQIATQILVLCSEQHARDRRSALERAESPESSSLPQVWMERFAAYYRIWSCLSGLGADLTAYRSTLLEPDNAWDRRFGTDAPDDPGYSREEQAEGYATFALYHYASFAWQLRQLSILYGGQWLLSDAEAEQAASDAIYRVTWHTPWNERDQSYLRTLISEAAGQEMHGFIQLLRTTEVGRTTEQEWQDWTGGCECSWLLTTGTKDEYFPTSRHHESISDTCELHQVVVACGDYLDLIDRDWKRLADWYHLDESARRGVSAEALYSWRARNSS